MKNANLIIEDISNNQIEDTLTSSDNGEFNYNLQFGRDYLIHFVRKDYLTSAVIIRTTNVKVEDVDKGQLFDFMTISLNRSELVSDWLKTISSKPRGEIYLDKTSGFFNWKQYEFTEEERKRLKKETKLYKKNCDQSGKKSNR